MLHKHPPVFMKLQHTEWSNGVKWSKTYKQPHRFSFKPSAALKSFYVRSFRPPVVCVFVAPSNLRYHNDIMGKQTLIIALRSPVTTEVKFTTWTIKVAVNIP